MSFYTLLKRFCVDAYLELTHMLELPRPPADSPIIARNPRFTHPLSKLDSHKNLQTYMQETGLSEKLHDAGHTWFWHEEVFEWLFLEQLLGNSYGKELNVKIFDTVFKRAQLEILRPFCRMRRITILTGFPELRRKLDLSNGVAIVPIEWSTHHYEIADLLGWRYQYRHRSPSFWIDPGSRLLIQTRDIPKGNDGKNLLDDRKAMRDEGINVVNSIRVAIDTPIYSKQVYFSHISSFPLLPIYHSEPEGSEGFSLDTFRPITKKEINNFRVCYRFLKENDKNEKLIPQFFTSAYSRFADSYRFTQREQSVVDLVVALEALFPVGDELRYRLASYVALVLGKDKQKKELYRKVSAAYKLRSSIVHGRKNQAESMASALKEFFPELREKSITDVNKNIWKAIRELQSIVRTALNAYINMKTRDENAVWPDNEDLEYLPFDSKKCCSVQKRLGL